MVLKRMDDMTILIERTFFWPGYPVESAIYEVDLELHLLGW